METLITIGIVSAAAFYLGHREWRARRGKKGPGAAATPDCGGGCDGCAFASRECGEPGSLDGRATGGDVFGDPGHHSV